MNEKFQYFLFEFLKITGFFLVINIVLDLVNGKGPEILTNIYSKHLLPAVIFGAVFTAIRTLMKRNKPGT